MIKDKTQFKVVTLIARVCILMAVLSLALPGQAQTTHTVINQNEVEALQAKTGVDTKTVNEIKDSLDTNSTIKPEITTPSSGGVVSGKNLQFKGIATPNVNIDILIEGTGQGVSPLMGKVTSDKYGVWSYFLGPELAAGNYTIQVFSQATNGAALYSDKIPFSVTETTSNQVAQTASAFGQSIFDQPLLLVILAILFSITLLGSMLIWATVYYLKNSQRNQMMNQMNNWQSPEIYNMNNEQWRQFLIKIDAAHRLFMEQRARAGLPPDSQKTINQQ